MKKTSTLLKLFALAVLSLPILYAVQHYLPLLHPSPVGKVTLIALLLWLPYAIWLFISVWRSRHRITNRRGLIRLILGTFVMLAGLFLIIGEMSHLLVTLPYLGFVVLFIGYAISVNLIARQRRR
jgi:hypothetical protein